ncbi:dethiobiotin synthase [Flavobacterium notoginsengisoli]|uniref:dethiobiotin synthase n=1 Tax=Flavobacterium notoginsengisoli TaxID=1478199 RepID=UPI0036280E28
MKLPKQFFVTGIGTGIGKTICSAVLAEYLQADYWKPIQSGDLDQSDSILVEQMISKNLKIHTERYRLKLAASPHKSAAEEQLNLKLEDFTLPQTNNPLIVEGAGGLFVPLSDTVLMSDLIRHFSIPIVLIARDYLGCINHTLLTLKALQAENIPLCCFVFNGVFDPDAQRVITAFLPTGIPILQLPDITVLEPASIQKAAKQIKILNHKKNEQTSKTRLDQKRNSSYL